MTTITDTAKILIRKKPGLTGRLMTLFDCTQNTIWNWIKSDDPRLTSKDALDVISKETGIATDQLLKEEAEYKTVV